MSFLLAATLVFSWQDAPTDEAVGGEPEPAAEVQARQWDLLGIAKAEGAKLHRRNRQRIEEILDGVIRTSEWSKVQAQRELEKTLALGANAVPVLIEILNEDPESPKDIPKHIARVGYSTGALILIFEATERGSILDSVQASLKSASPPLAVSILTGLRRLDHPRVYAMAQPLLQSNDKEVRDAAILVMAQQTNPSVAEQLRPLLKDPTVNQSYVIYALHQQRDASSEVDVHRVWVQTNDAEVKQRAVEFFHDCGTQESLSMLVSGLFHPENEANTPLRQKILSAVQAIGLRGSDEAKSVAEQILVRAMDEIKVYKLTRSAANLLAPFGNEVAYQRLLASTATALAREPNSPALLLDQARLQLLFERWKDAMTSITKAERADEKRAYSGEIANYKVVAQCGLSQYAKAERSLRKASQTGAELLALWPVLQKMAEQARYRPLFEAE